MFFITAEYASGRRQTFEAFGERQWDLRKHIRPEHRIYGDTLVSIYTDED